MVYNADITVPLVEMLLLLRSRMFIPLLRDLDYMKRRISIEKLNRPKISKKPVLSKSH